MGASQQAMLMAAAASSGDPYWANVKALLNMGGAHNSTTFTDSTGLRTWTAAGNAKIDTSTFSLNTSFFDGTGDYVTTPYIQADLDWWTGDFTVEAWVRLDSSWATWGYNVTGGRAPSLVGCANVATTTNYWSFGPANNFSGQPKVSFYYYNGGQNLITMSSNLSTTPAWNHIALTHSGGTIYLAMNGTVENMGAVSGTPQSSTGVPLTLGQINSRSIGGYVRALRITRAARYTANFTPESAPFLT